MFVRNYHRGNKWIPGVIQQKTGPVSYRVKLANGNIRRCHQDQIRKRSVEIRSPQDSNLEPELPDIEEDSMPTEHSNRETTESSTNGAPTLPASNADEPVVSPNPVRSYPTRNRTPVVRFEPTWT